MSRIGLRPDTASVEMVKKIAALPGVKIDGMFTHLRERMRRIRLVRDSSMIGLRTSAML